MVKLSQALIVYKFKFLKRPHAIRKVKRVETQSYNYFHNRFLSRETCCVFASSLYQTRVELNYSRSWTLWIRVRPCTSLMSDTDNFTFAAHWNFNDIHWQLARPTGAAYTISFTTLLCSILRTLCIATVSSLVTISRAEVLK